MRLDGKAANTYRVYGLRLWSNRTIPGLVGAPLGEARPGDLWVELTGPRPRRGVPARPVRVLRASPGRDERGEPYFQACQRDEREGASVQLRWSNGDVYLEFLLDPAGHWVRAAWSEAVSYSDVMSPLLGVVLGCVLRLRGVTCLHASAVAVGPGDQSTAIAIVGAKFGGKSTLAAALAGRGHAVLSDDLAVLTDDERGLLVQPGVPRLRLWPDAMAALPGVAATALPRVWQDLDLDKRYLDLTTDPGAPRWRFQSKALPLAAVYVLGEEPGPPEIAPHITPIPPADGLIALVRNVYVDYVLDRAGRARDFQALGRLAETVPLRQVHRPWGLEFLPQICTAILDDAARRV